MPTETIGSQASASSSNVQSSAGSSQAGPLVWSAFVVMTCVMAITVLGMFWACLQQVEAFSKGIEVAVKEPVDHAAIAAYTTGISGAFVKTFSILLSFVLIFAGAVYVLLPIRAKYRADAETKAGKGSLETNSPGLVMIVIGALLAGFSVWHPVTVDYTKRVAAQEGVRMGGGGETTTFTPPKESKK